MGRYFYAPCCIAKQRCVLEVIGGNTCTWTVPVGTSEATFELWGGGGAGGAHCCCYCGAVMGGAGGGYTIKSISVTPGDTYSITSGAGGSKYYCSATAAGCRGCTSYVNGTGLSNLCAEGGGGGCGHSANAICMNACICCAGNAYGGDRNIMGGYSYNKTRLTLFCAYSVGGASPFGGGEVHMQGNHCCPYFTCGADGSYPGGGGSGHTNCCCDCCGCSGAGAPGLVRITF